MNASSPKIENDRFTSKICFVAMPFGSGDEYKGQKKESNFILSDIIRPAVEEGFTQFRKDYPDSANFSLEVVRELEDTKPGSISESIIRHLAEAHITIVDLTGRNPNVFLELGVRFALKRNGTILLTQDSSDLPFNVRNFRTVEYNPFYDDVHKAKQSLRAAIHKTLTVLEQELDKNTDSLVYQAISDLRVSRSDLLNELPSEIDWLEYWSRIVHIANVLKELSSSGVYKPDILIGISNGGLLLADTVLRIVYDNSLPLICLWAFRRNPKERYFENIVNDALITSNVLSKLAGNDEESMKSSPIRVLVMDDMVGTQRTFTQLIEYMQTQLGDFYQNIEFRFTFIYTPTEETISELSGYLLSHDKAINKLYKMPQIETVTRRSELPYRKSIHYGTVLSQKETKPRSGKEPKKKK